MHESNSARKLSRRQALQLLASIPVLLMLPSGLVQAARVRILGLRHWIEPHDSKRLVLDLDAQADFTQRVFDDPPRLVLRLPGASLTQALEQAWSDDTLIERLWARQDPDGVEITVEFSRAATVEVFHQAPSGDKGHRLVVDLAPRLTPAERAAQEERVRAVRESGDRIVAIDPGHGGEDPGTVYGRLQEKDIALAVGRLLQQQISMRPGLRGVLTRSTDHFIPLARRQEIARQYGADLFVSVHVNSAQRTQARGAEVFFLSLAGSEDKAAHELVNRENAADLVGGVPADQVNAPLVDILMDMTRNQTMKDSEKLAEVLLQHLGRVESAEVRGVKQGPLAVLKSIDKPSVLVELGFITSKADRGLLVKAQRDYASRLADGILDYLG
ncbi:MAG TPA: N-acetylmuramoyl-L-alanine amidase [Candidatus Krumholzibacteria bacterium]|nr:N-acetylmuramoyl-L-alanine amidase [Candidatus Krumholzibacteria bacterium]